MEEVWKPIPGYGGYEVSNLGRVRSYHIKGSRRLSSVPHVLKHTTDKRSGYQGTGLGKGNFRRIHHLVLLAFVGPCPDGLEALHNDDNKSNNRLDNLRYDTHLANMQDVVKNHNGIHPKRKHTVKQAPRIYTSRDELIEAYKTSKTVEEVSQKLGIKPKTVVECASRLRRFGFDIPKLSRLSEKSNVKLLSRVKLLQVLLAWESGKLNEWQVSKFLRMSIAEIHSLKKDNVNIGKELANVT